MKLHFEAMQILNKELQQNQMWAIYLIALGKEMTDNVTKVDLVKIIEVLCKKLKRIEDHEDYNSKTKMMTSNKDGEDDVISLSKEYKIIDKITVDTKLLEEESEFHADKSVQT